MNENSTETSIDHHLEGQHHSYRHGGEWVGGAMLVLIGLLLLGKNMKIASFDNWWAFFILLPAFGSFSTAWKMYQSAGRFTMRARSAGIVGIVLSLITTMFLFNINWTYLGPGLLILAGVGFWFNVLLPD